MSYEEALASDLKTMAEAQRYRRWIYRRISPDLGRRVLEVGAGRGNFTELLLDRDLIIPTDVHPLFLDAIQSRFPGAFRVAPFLWDIAEPLGDRLAPNTVDTVVCINVLEHVEDDRAALRHMGAVLPNDGKLILLVPALEWLYGSVDRAIGHYRRYGKRELTARLTETGFCLERILFMNVLGIPGWFLNGRLLGHTESSPSQVKVFDRYVVPWAEPIERVLRPPFGLSLIAVGRKTPAGA